MKQLLQKLHKTIKLIIFFTIISNTFTISLYTKSNTYCSEQYPIVESTNTVSLYSLIDFTVTTE